MRIYRKIGKWSDSYYFMTSKENGLFCFSLALPDRNTLTLNECHISDEEKAYDNAVIVSDSIYKRFNKLYNKKGNYNGICSLLMEVFDDVDQNSLNKAFRRNDDVFDLTDKCIKEYGSEVYDYYYRELSQDVEYYMKIWDNNHDRIIKWMITEEIPNKMVCYHPMIDIFGEHHPTEYKLLHKFYSHWGKKLDSIINKCIEEYPDEKDFDLATYRCSELLINSNKNK